LGNLTAAERGFRRSVELAGPGRGAPARTNLGIIMEMQGRLAGAREQYLEAARASSRWKDARLRLALMYEADGNLQEALRWWRELAALEAEPEKIQAHIRELEQKLENTPAQPGAVP
jgi:Flp pilus assembly protein TadD